MFAFQQGSLISGLFLTSQEPQTLNTMTSDLKPWWLLPTSPPTNSNQKASVPLPSTTLLCTMSLAPEGRDWGTRRAKYGEPRTGIPNVGSQSSMMIKNGNKGKNTFSVSPLLFTHLACHWVSIMNIVTWLPQRLSLTMYLHVSSNTCMWSLRVVCWNIWVSDDQPITLVHSVRAPPQAYGKKRIPKALLL